MAWRRVPLFKESSTNKKGTVVAEFLGLKEVFRDGRLLFPPKAKRRSTQLLRHRYWRKASQLDAAIMFAGLAAAGQDPTSPYWVR